MINKTAPIFLLCLFSTIIFCSCSSFGHISNTIGTEWSYAIDNGTEKTERAYLLVYAPKKPEERRVKVVSRCQKPYPAEGVYGACTHTIDVHPAHIQFNLNTGEDVVMVQFTWDAPFILATIEYGCCAGHDTIYFYTDKGEYLGKIIGYSTASRANNGSLFARTFDFGNATRDNETIYLLVSDEDRANRFQALVFESGKAPVRIPVLGVIPDQEMCGDWYIDKFIKYGDRNDLTLKINGLWCKNDDDMQERPYHCTAGEKAITCLPDHNRHK